MPRQYVRIELCRVRIELCRVPAPDGGPDLVNYATFPIEAHNAAEAWRAILAEEATLVEVDDPTDLTPAASPYPSARPPA